MNWKTLAAVATVFTVSMFVGSHDARALLIDDFADLHSISTGVAGTTDSDNPVVNANILGDTRNIQITLTTLTCVSPNCLLAQTDGGGTQQFLQGLLPGQDGSTVVTWGVSAGGAGDALGGVDVTDAGASNALRVEVLSTDLGGTLTFELTDTAGHTATGAIVMTAAGDETLLFTAMVLSNVAFDFTMIDKITMTTSGPQSLDFAIKFLDTTLVPEPATLALFGIGLLGLGVLSRRRRRHPGGAELAGLPA